MWTFLLFLLMFHLFPAGISAVATFLGYRGRSVEIRCSYESGFETYIKYLCRGACSTLPGETKDIPVESGSAAKDQRFSLKDDTAARVFTITITDLRPEDAGQYWCSIQRSYPLTDVYTEIMLLVKTDDPKSTTVITTDSSSSTQSTNQPYTESTGYSSVTPTTNSISTVTNHGSQNQNFIYITVGLVVMVIVLLMALTVLYKLNKKPKTSKVPVEMTPLNTVPSSPEENKTKEVPTTDDCIYQEIDEPQPEPANPSTVNTIYSTAEELTDSSIYSTIDEPTTLTVYSAVTLPQQNPTNSPSPQDEYSTVTLPLQNPTNSPSPQDEYSTVTPH